MGIKNFRLRVEPTPSPASHIACGILDKLFNSSDFQHIYKMRKIVIVLVVLYECYKD